MEADIASAYPMAISRFSFEMADPKHLEHLLRAIRGVQGVYDVYRVTSA